MAAATGAAAAAVAVVAVVSGELVQSASKRAAGAWVMAWNHLALAKGLAWQQDSVTEI